MRMRNRQRGLGWFGLLFVLGIIAFFAIVVVKCLPIYLNQMKIASSINKVAADPENGKAEVVVLRKALGRYWDIESIDYLTPAEVRVRRTEGGRFLSYEYEAREHLFYNISLVIEFADDVPLSNVGS
ncbi:DUF4845 domain-containing protein [Sinimarinibacterium sp. CAU 1509]|uniref:DUF4845 domain-containing protein n=1 Tax=Sinimarinibacterium sp. CAU 1509 TaxID=2562283 RepID=UPI0010AC9DEB|nr:DUF4845 domain-containing protein [Sinimarinibacterium sp. CAU 1509]TJY63067.1 DUF4845 domain-containing protein [Sinimarinibacterium sp. CAU 1509]